MESGGKPEASAMRRKLEARNAPSMTETRNAVFGRGIVAVSVGSRDSVCETLGESEIVFVRVSEPERDSVPPETVSDSDAE